MSREYPCVYFEKDGVCRKFSDDTILSYCVMGPCPEETLSNADRIRAMSDEELAKWLEYEGGGACVEVCGWLGWLQQPAKEEI